MIKQNVIHSLLFLILSNGLIAQKTDKLFKEAEKLFFEENFKEALVGFNQIMEIEPTHQQAEYKAEICILLTTNQDMSFEKMRSFSETLGRQDKFYPYWMGRIYARQYNYDMAIASWESFLRQDGYKSKEIVAETRAFLADARKKKSFLTSPADFRMTQLDGSINSESAELSPVFIQATNELLFVSSKEAAEDKETFRVYHSTFQNGAWNPVSEIEALGLYTRETANLQVVDEDGKLFVFDPRKGGDLFYSEAVQGKWRIPVEFDSKVTGNDINSHFFINSHEDRIIFSTRTKANGLDLYQSFKDVRTGKWTKPTPFAPEINGMGDEDSPYLSEDEMTLYFSSTGHSSIGGYDVFMSEFDSVNLAWSEPVQLGFPINSPGDEINFKLSSDGSFGYLSSNRIESLGDFDIYYFNKIEKIELKGSVIDEQAKQPFTDAIIRFVSEQYPSETLVLSTGEKGRYFAEIIAGDTYTVEVLRGDSIVYTDKLEIQKTEGLSTTYLKDFILNSPGLSSIQLVHTVSSVEERAFNEIQSDIESERLSINRTSEMSDYISFEMPLAVGPVHDLPKPHQTGRKAIIHNVYFDFGTARLSQNAQPVLEDLYNVLVQNPGLTIEIGGHTDNVGSPDVNEWLSQNRAEAVKSWLIRKGIGDSRLTTRGYGAALPLASNDDEKNGRELNRRIEVLVINK